jgi:hypothetical protein
MSTPKTPNLEIETTVINQGFVIISEAIDRETIDALIAQLPLLQNKDKNTRKNKNYGTRDILNLVPQFRQFANSRINPQGRSSIVASNVGI